MSKKNQTKYSTGSGFRTSQEGTDSEFPKADKSKPDANSEFKPKMTTDEYFLNVNISEVEETNLSRVFNLFVGDRKFKEGEKFWFDATDVRRILKKLGDKEISQHQIDIMIWEVDENLDKRVDITEFNLMYRKCIEDKTGLEPKNLFNLVQFLMFCRYAHNKLL